MDNEKIETQLKELKQGCLALIVSLACVPLGGWVITKLWGWYVVPFGIPQISLAHAIGLNYLITYLTACYHKESRTLTERIIIPIATPLIFLLMGWIVSLFM